MPATYTRIYAGDDGVSRFEDVELEMRPNVAASASHSTEAAPAIPVLEVSLRRWVAGSDSDWHPAPMRQVVFVVSGTLEVTAGDGEVRRLVPGNILLADDLTGKHRTRPFDGECVIADIPWREGSMLGQMFPGHGRRERRAVRRERGR